SYRNRLMLTHNSGMTTGGWAYSLSASRRWATEGYVPGTFYNGYSYYAGLSRRLGGRHLLSLFTLGSAIRRGKSAALTEEAVAISGSRFYNPAWGYQQGRKRSARTG